jgi:hypothetical protein
MRDGLENRFRLGLNFGGDETWLLNSIGFVGKIVDTGRTSS